MGWYVITFKGGYITKIVPLTGKITDIYVFTGNYTIDYIVVIPIDVVDLYMYLDIKPFLSCLI